MTLCPWHSPPGFVVTRPNIMVCYRLLQLLNVRNLRKQRQKHQATSVFIQVRFANLFSHLSRRGKLFRQTLCNSVKPVISVQCIQCLKVKLPRPKLACLNCWVQTRKRWPMECWEQYVYQSLVPSYLCKPKMRFANSHKRCIPSVWLEFN